MNPDSEPALVVYRSEIEQATASLDVSVVEQIALRGVRWECQTNIDSEDFADRIGQGVGYYTLMHNVSTAVPRNPSCNAPPEGQEIIATRNALVTKFGALMAYMPELVAGMDSDGPIQEVVAGLTGVPPTWGNVLRITADQQRREAPVGELRSAKHVPGANLSPAASQRLRENLLDIGKAERAFGRGEWRHYPR